MGINKLISAVSVVVLALQAAAQTDISLKAGANFSTITGKSVDNGDFRGGSGFYGGFTVTAKVGKKFSVQPEFLYSSKSYFFTELSSDNKVAFGYFCLPVLVQYHIKSGFYAETGPQFAVLASAKRKSDNIPSGE